MQCPPQHGQIVGKASTPHQKGGIFKPPMGPPDVLVYSLVHSRPQSDAKRTGISKGQRANRQAVIAVDWIGAESAQISGRDSRIYQISLPRFLIEALDIYSKVKNRSAYIRQQFAQNLQFFCISRLCRGRVKHKPILPAITERVINHLLNFSIIEPCLLFG